MSITGLALSGAQLALLQRAFIRPARSVGGLIPMTVMAEHHTDRLQLSEHPLEKGANIADHAIKLPAVVMLEYKWSNSPRGSVFSSAQPTQMTVQEVYAKLLELQSTFTLLDVYTGKRRYQSMILLEVTQTTDKENENALSVTITCQQVLFATTQTIMLSSAATSVNGKQPSITAPTVNSGVRQLQPAPLYSGGRP